MAGAPGEYAGKAFRIGHMGNADDYDMVTALTAIERGLAKLGVSVECGKAAGVYRERMTD